MFDAIISGRIHGKPEQRTGKNGSRFVTLKLRVPCSDGPAMFASAICFGDTVSAQLLELTEGDAVTLSGAVAVKPYINGGGVASASLDVTVHACLTAYHVSRKREAMKPPKQDKPSKGQTAAYMAAMAPSRPGNMYPGLAEDVF